MEKITVEIKKCWTCLRYKPYYGKFAAGFSQMPRGNCRKKHTDVNNTETCEFWESNAPKKYKDRKFTLRKLDEAIEDINAIKLVLQDNAKENEIDQ